MTSKSPEVILRPFEEKDREQIRSICCRTAQRGNPATVFFEDEEIVPMLYADYYMDYEPESCFVAEVNGWVVGYYLGCKNTLRYVHVLRTRIYPCLFLRILWKILTLRYRERKTYRTLWWIIKSSWREIPSPPFYEYPAHAHSNIESRYRGQKLNLRLSMAFHKQLMEHRVKGIHAIIPTFSTHLCHKRGYRLVAINRFTLWEKLTGKKWYLKLFVCDLHPSAEGSLDAPSKR